jgi:uncharacterized membrane protein
MGDLGSAKTLGGVGAILMLVGVFVPFLSIVGLILVFMGVKSISETVNNPKIKSDFILSVVLGIVAIILVFVAPFAAFGGFGLFTSMNYTNPFEEMGGALAICLVLWIIAVIFYILSSLYLKKSFEGIASHTKVDMFKTAGMVYFIGAILMFILIGAFIMLISYILMIVAFFSLPDNLQQVGAPGQGQPAYPQQPQQPQQTGRICPACGRPIPMDAQVCPYCGKDFRQQ